MTSTGTAGPTWLIGAYGDQDDRRWAGSITVLHGGAEGLSGANAQYVVNDVDAYQFGLRLAAGDVDGDGVADLVQVANMGTVSRIIGYRGGSEGLDTANAFTKDLPGYTVAYTSVAIGDLTEITRRTWPWAPHNTAPLRRAVRWQCC